MTLAALAHFMWKYFLIGCLLGVAYHVIFRWNHLRQIWRDEEVKTPAKRAAVRRFLSRFKP